MNTSQKRPSPENGDAHTLSNAQLRMPDTINRALAKRTPVRHRAFDEVIDGLQLLTPTDVCRLLRISKPTLWRLRRSGDFPEPIAVTERIFGWRRREIDAWLASRPNSRRY